MYISPHTGQLGFWKWLGGAWARKFGKHCFKSKQVYGEVVNWYNFIMLKFVQDYILLKAVFEGENKHCVKLSRRRKDIR